MTRQSAGAASTGGEVVPASGGEVVPASGGGGGPASGGGGGPASGGGGAHTPLVHARPSHDVPHAPQSAESVSRFASHPSDATPLQFAKPDLHAIPQATPLHVAIALA